jgi:hypothetical protein
MSNKVRVMRILIYEGDYDWVKTTLEHSAVPMDGIKRIEDQGQIKSALIDKLPEIMCDNKEVTTKQERTWLNVDDIKEMTNNVINKSEEERKHFRF